MLIFLREGGAWIWFGLILNLDPFLVAVQTVGDPADSQQDEPTTGLATGTTNH